MIVSATCSDAIAATSNIRICRGLIAFIHYKNNKGFSFLSLDLNLSSPSPVYSRDQSVTVCDCVGGGLMACSYHRQPIGAEMTYMEI